jgi:DNA-binding GntR family transcriptional regulator
VWRGLTKEDAVTQTIREHRPIATAVRDRQPAIARARATAHIAGVETCLRHSLADPDSQAGLASVAPAEGLTIPA